MDKIGKLFHQISYLTLVIVTFFMNEMIFTQVNVQWLVSYNRIGTSDDFVSTMKTDNLGNVYIAGYSQDSQGKYDCTVIKYNSAGIQQWVSYYNGPGDGNDFAFSLALDASGNIYITGSSWGNAVSMMDCITIKYNPNGIQQWAARYNFANFYDGAFSIAADNTGNVYIAGRSDSSAANPDFIMIKYNSSGVQQWATRYNASGKIDIGRQLVLDNAGSVFVTGYSEITSNNLDFLTVKYNTNGVQQWASRYNGPADSGDNPQCISLDVSGNIYVSGESKGINTGNDYTTIKYNSGGAQQWVSRYNGSANGSDKISSMAVDAAGNVYVTGGTNEINAILDCTTIKYNTAGVQQWIKAYNGPASGFDGGNYVTFDNTGSVYITGYTEIDSSEDSDYLIIKYNSTGTQQWIKMYDNGTADEGIDIKVDSTNNIIISGYTNGSGTGYDITTIKYSQIVGITAVSTEIPSEFTLYQNYPNPFNPLTKLRFDLPNSGDVKIAVYDMIGKEVQILADEFKEAGSYEINFDASVLASGTYFYKLTSGNNSEIKKMILLK